MKINNEKIRDEVKLIPDGLFGGAVGIGLGAVIAIALTGAFSKPETTQYTMSLDKPGEGYIEHITGFKVNGVEILTHSVQYQDGFVGNRATVVNACVDPAYCNKMYQTVILYNVSYPFLTVGQETVEVRNTEFYPWQPVTK